MKALKITLLILVLSITAFMQSKIALIDTNAFYESKTGISELVMATERVNQEFSRVQKQIEPLTERLKKIAIEIQDGHRYRAMTVSESEIKKEVEKLILESQELSNKIKSIVDEVAPQIKKRHLEIVEPINTKIKERLKVFAKNKGYTTIIDSSKMQYNEVVCFFHDDLTKEFIKFCNEEFEREKTQDFE